MDYYEDWLRKRIEHLSKSEKIKLLETIEWNINMRDSWTDEEYRRMHIVEELLKEVKEN